MAGKFSGTLAEIADISNLKLRGHIAFGLNRGYLIAIRDFLQSGQFALTARFPREEDTERVSQSLDQKALLKMVGAMGNMQVQPGVISLTVVPKWKALELSQVKALLDTIINVLSSKTPPYLSECVQCGNTTANVVLINGIPELRCTRCLNKIRREMQGAISDWESKKPNYKKGLTYATLALFISAFAWATIAYVF